MSDSEDKVEGSAKVHIGRAVSLYTPATSSIAELI